MAVKKSGAGRSKTAALGCEGEGESVSSVVDGQFYPTAGAGAILSVESTTPT